MTVPWRLSRFAGYSIAVLVGMLAIWNLIPFATLLGTGGMWRYPEGDTASSLIGHLGFQANGWSFPPLVAANLMWPHGISVLATDSNPLFSLLGKFIAAFTGSPVNLLGVWYATCWLLQPVSAVYALRGFGCRSWETAATAAILSVLFPALLTRIGHTNLCGHFLLMTSLGLTARLLRCGRGATWRDWAAPFLLLMVAILSHVYLFLFAAGILAAVPVRAMLDRHARRLRIGALFLLTMGAPVGLTALLSGPMGGADAGFGLWSMNLLSPVWPQHSGLFGSSLPIIDATGGQAEGFNYLGAGSLLLILFAALVSLWRVASGGRTSGGRASTWRTWRGLVIVLTGFALLALSTRVFAGKYLILDLGTKPWDQVFGIVRSSGRAFWPVGYALVLGSIACLSARLPAWALRPLLLIAIVLQLIDTTPFRDDARSQFARSGQPPPFELPAGATMLTTVPVCAASEPAQRAATALRLAAAWRGMRLADVHVGRSPGWFNCETPLSDGTELPLRDGEVRVFVEPNERAPFRAAAIGEPAACGQLDALIVCTTIPGMPLLPAPPRGAALAAVTMPSGEIAGDRLQPLLSFGWQPDAAGAFWSEGPRASLLFQLHPALDGQPVSIDLKLEGVAGSEGGTRDVRILVGDTEVQETALPDFRAAHVTFTVAAGRMHNGILRIAFDMKRPLDPAKRGLKAPVNRAGVKLLSIDVRSIGP